MATDAELLEKVETAITRVLEGGQDVMHGDRRVTLADLPALRAFRKDLQDSIDRAARGGARVTSLAPRG